MLHRNRWWSGLVLAGLAAVLLLGGCQPVVRPVVQAGGLAQGTAYQAPEVLVHGAQIHSPNGIKSGPDGNLYVASVTEQAILVIDPDTGKIVKRLGPEVGVDGPDDLAFGPDGSIYWTDFFKGSVGRLAPDGSASSQMVAPGVNPIAVAQDGRVFVGLAFLGDALYELDPNLAAPPRLLAEGLGGLNSFQFGPDGKLYSPVMEKGQVVRIDVDADPITVDVVAEGLSWPVAVKFDSQGRLYTTNPPGIVRVDMQTGATEPVGTVPYGIDNFALDAKDRIFVSMLAEGTVGEALPNGEMRMLGPAGMVMPGGVLIAQRADGESIYVADGWMLDEFDRVTGELRRKVDNLGPNTVASDGDNLLLSGWFGNGVVVWNPQTEKVVEEYYDFAMPLNAVRFGGDLVVAELGSGSVVRASGADPSQRETLIKDLGVPGGLATNGEELWVGDRAAGNIWELAAGGELLPEPKLLASGLDRPEGITVADGRLLVAEAGTGRLLAIDLATSAVSTLVEGLGFSPDGPAGGPPTFVMKSMAVDPTGVIYVTGDRAGVLYRIKPVE
jgi:sugar lactone lactonase YvrE